jgi:glycosyltransferase involved in cell wall biosynthesis
MRKIILHDYFETPDGGGKLSLILAKHLHLDIGYGFISPNYANYFNLSHNQRQINLNSFSRIPIWKQFKLSRAFQTRTNFLRRYDKIIFSGTYAPLASSPQHPSNIYYCHTPPRFIYDQFDFYLGLLPAWQKPIFKAFVQYLKPQYEDSVANMHKIITNSKHVKHRIFTYLGKQATVIYPPCNSDGLTWEQPDNYYLSTARLDPLKRVDLIVSAFMRMPKKKLIVASGGTELKKLRDMAKHATNIEFTGWINQQKLVQLINHAIATLYLPRNEDFGISPVESMSAGKPVIGVAEGGLIETIIDNETGILLPVDFTVENIIDAVNSMSTSRSLRMRTACLQRAELFSTTRFINQIRDFI